MRKCRHEHTTAVWTRVVEDSVKFLKIIMTALASGPDNAGLAILFQR